MNLPALQPWEHFSTASGFHLALTLAAWTLADRLAQRLGRPALLNPVVVSALTIVIALLSMRESYDAYFAGSQLIHALLGPATIALALPLYAHRRRIADNWVPVVAALVAGVFTAIVVAIGTGLVLGVSADTLRTLAARAATAPVAMAITEQLRGIASLAAVMAVATGMLGAMIAIPLLRRCRIGSPAAIGLALGTISHGIGTARALQEDDETGAFAALAMALAAPIATVMVPTLVTVIG